jgi:hypothetical protein
VTLLAVACGDSSGSTPTESAATTSPDGPDTASPSSDAPSCASGADEGAANLLQNPGFEAGDEPWISLAQESGFAVTAERAHSGANSARLRMRDSAGEVGTDGAKVYYLVQEMSPQQLPELVCGYYFAENWVKGSPHQYVQFVVIAFAPANFESTYPNYQLRYILGGADSPPFAIDNARFVFVTRTAQPGLGQWIPFELHLREDFERLWGRIPEGFEKLRLLFEVRWDNKVAGVSPAEADVYYDDLYAGPGD